MADLRLCSISDCGKPVQTAGYCNGHYLRFRRHGDPLAGRIGTGVPRRYLEDVVLSYDGDECLIWPFSNNSNGYGQISKGGRPEIVSRIVCEHVNGQHPPESNHAAHLCGNGRQGCVTPKHLVWKTPLENSADRAIHGTNPRGERNGHAKLTAEDILTIRSLFGVETQRQISRQFAVSEQTICDIKKGRVWSHI